MAGAPAGPGITACMQPSSSTSTLGHGSRLLSIRVKSSWPSVEGTFTPAAMSELSVIHLAKSTKS
eukprot:CAMPEP_0202822038 /NCGR_PEP_ID=MMETSP1389-20130828/10797_1 /ASSEMBLY_ACC=CAM_ASM_000865 /TAXON_ID=302021 /ORGANISM="Rhodomonas sp., Strain CCMP768" /LENGTH=64 /DNA_ID=CAMNT_0049494895 /DNA_START=39 /DNA_END=230 /DNA_ORIENTATION=+